jgi:hypothetical protein
MQQCFSNFLCTCGRAQMMTVRTILLPLFLILFSPTLFAQQFDVLMITETAGWQHESSFDAIPAMRKMAARHYFNIDLKQKAERLTADQLAQYEVILMINTTGDVFNDEEQALVEQFIQSGKGWVGVHAASDTEYDWKWYTEMVGHMFKIHPVIQTGMVDVVDKDFPGMATWPDRLLWTDEFYEFKDGTRRPDFNYLITVDESTYDFNAKWSDDNVARGHGDFHPMAWYHDYDGGRAFYTNFGHVPAVFQEDVFLEHLYGGIYWAATGNK